VIYFINIISLFKYEYNIILVVVWQPVAVRK
jgi:hypothetical protein